MSLLPDPTPATPAATPGMPPPAPELGAAGALPPPAGEPALYVATAVGPLPVARPAPAPLRAVSPLACPRCRLPLGPQHVNVAAPAACPQCGTRFKADVFPAYFHDLPAGREGEPLRAAGEASCFHHPEARAEVVCDGCGRFLCATCDLPAAGRHLCPPCLTRLVTVDRPGQFLAQAYNWEGLALLLTLVPLLCLLAPAFITAPLAIYLALRGRRRQSAPVRTMRAMGSVALVLAVVELVVWIGAVTYFIIEAVQGRL